MGIKCGIVGLPNVGKSTLFNALTRAQIAAENYPFCTIDPNVGIVPVPDPRLDTLATIVKPQKILPTTVEFVDIAGLVAGASQGEGLGNKFLAHIRECDALAHVVRCFENADVVHVSGRVLNQFGEPVAGARIEIWQANAAGLRAPHIHFDVTGRVNKLVTQMFFPGEPLNARDAILRAIPGGRQAAVTGRILAPTKNLEPDSLVALWDIVLITG